MEVEETEKMVVSSSEGGKVWQVDDMTRLHRFLVLGSDLPTYYIGEKGLSDENKAAIRRLLDAGMGPKVVNEISLYSRENRSPKQDYLVYALAACARQGNLETKRMAYKILSEVCKIPTHLFMFIDHCEKLSAPSTGWGRAHRNAIKKWYTDKKPKELALYVTKYRQRDGWSHRDVIKLMHLKPRGKNVPDHVACVLCYTVHGWGEKVLDFCKMGVDQDTNHVMEYLRAVEEVRSLKSHETTVQDEEYIVQRIKEYKLVWEHIPTNFLKQNKIWRALLGHMPMTAIIRNLNKMTAVGLLRSGCNETSHVCDKLTNEGLLKAARIHPFNVLKALKQYQAGHGDKGKLQWRPVPEVVRALENAFYKSFKNVEPTKQRFLSAIDVSSSMRWGGCAGSPNITPAVASAAMAMVTAKTEEHHYFVAFSQKMIPLPITSSMNLENVLELVEKVDMGGTDCALPMLYAIEEKLAVDVFIVYTDCETRAGPIHSSEALRNYRRQSGINAKLIVVAMTSNGFTIADPEDPGMFDMVGFDSAAPQVMKEFIMGGLE